MQTSNAAIALVERAKAQPATVAIRAGDRVFSYGDLSQSVILAAQHMYEIGIRPKTTVAVRCDDLLALLATIYATALIGCRWAPASGDILNSDALRPDFVFDAETDLSKRLPGAMVLDGTWAQPPSGSARTTFDGYASADDIWIISPTFGTSGTRKFVGLSHRVVQARNAASRDWFDRPGRKVAGLFPPGAPVLTARCIAALAAGCEIVAGATPEDWLAQDVDLVFGSVAQVREAMDGQVLDRKLPLIYLMGATAPAAFVRQLLKSFDRVANGYGSTEAYNSLSLYKSLAPDGSLRVEVVRGEAEVEVVDESGVPAPVGHEGVVRVRSACAVDKYLGNPAATAATFRDGWFYPGDLGMWTSDGVFLVTGRTNDQFNLGGVKLNAALLDYTLQTVEGMRDAACFMLPQDDGSESLRAFVDIEPGYEPDIVLSRARVALIRLGGRAAVPERFLFADEIPRGTDGKPDRRACALLVRRQRAVRRASRHDASHSPE